MNWHKINYSSWVTLMLPPRLRKQGVLSAMLRAGIKPISTMHTAYMQYRKEVDYRINHNGQKCKLQAVLNDEFDKIQRGILISENDAGEWGDLLYKEAEDRPMLLEVVILNMAGYLGTNAIDFTVRVPTRLGFEQNDWDKMSSLIRYYKLASKRWVYEQY